MFRRSWINLPLASKIAVFASVLIVLIILALTLMMIQRERKSFRSELEAQAGLILTTLSERLRDPLLNDRVTEIDEIALDMKGNRAITRFKVYSSAGELIVDADQPELNFPTDRGPLSPLTRSQLSAIPEFYWDKDLVTEIGIFTAGKRIGFLQMGFSTAPLDQKIRALTIESLAIAAAALLTGILLAALISRQLTNPIRELTHTANRMAAGDLSARLQPEGQDEIGQLGRAFNDLASAVEKRETDLRNLAASLEQTVFERTAELQQQNQYLAALNDVTLGLIENLEIEKLLEAIMTRAASLANTEHAFVTVVDADQGETELRVAQGGYRKHLGLRMKMTQGLTGLVIASRKMLIEKDYQAFEDRHPYFDWLRTAVYVPLQSDAGIIGVIGIGYDQVVPIHANHVDILNQFAQLASLAMKNAQLYSAARQELTETEQALVAEEARREAYLASPQGRAEAAADRILVDPAGALAALHDFTQKVEQNTNAMILQELPGVLERAGFPLLARLAEGYDFVSRSGSEPDLLAAGLRRLWTTLQQPEAGNLFHGDEALAIYSFCQQSVDAGSTHAINELLPSLQALPAEDHLSMLAELAGALQGLLPVMHALHAYERVDTPEDRRDYLARAVEWLAHVDRLTRGLGAADGPIVQRIVENWMGVVTLSMSDLQTRAQIACRLLSRHSWKEGMVVVALQLCNPGHGVAINLRVSLSQSEEYIGMGERLTVERLAPGEEVQLELQVQPQYVKVRDQFRVRFVILYDDPSGHDHTEHFADIVHILVPESPFQMIPNPYMAGKSLEAGSPLFFGREDLFQFILENLSAAHQNNLVLIGQRRTGKSSLLKQLPLRLGEDYLPVYLDGQGIAIDPGMPAFFANLAMEIGFALQERGFDIRLPDLGEFSERPAYTFKHDYLRRVRAAIGARHLVLLLDEFEALEAAVKSGSLDVSVFSFLRHLIQHESWLSMIFCGTHRMEELVADYWSVLFNLSLYRHVGFLEYGEAARLIQEPVAAYGMSYDDLALDKMWRITAGHPYFLQLICHSLVNLHNRAGRSYVTVSDVNAALDEILSSGEAHFIYLWNESSLAERLVLTALSRIITLTGHIMPAQVEDYLNERGIILGRQVVVETLHHLTLRDILTAQMDIHTVGAAGIYGWRLGLLGLWIEKYQSLSLLQEGSSL